MNEFVVQACLSVDRLLSFSF